MAVDSLINYEFEKSIQMFPSDIEKSTDRRKGFYETYISGMDQKTILAVLNSLLQKILMSQNRIITFCNEQVIKYGDGFYTYEPIISQDIKYVQPGQSINITAAIGSYSVRAQPQFVIDGRRQKLSEDGAVHVAIKAAKTPGKHYVDISVDFNNAEGNKATSQRSLVYYVIDTAQKHIH